MGTFLLSPHGDIINVARQRQEFACKSLQLAADLFFFFFSRHPDRGKSTTRCVLSSTHPSTPWKESLSAVVTGACAGRAAGRAIDTRLTDEEKLKHASASFAILLLYSRDEKVAYKQFSFLLSGLGSCRLVHATGAGGCASHRRECLLR